STLKAASIKSPTAAFDCRVSVSMGLGWGVRLLHLCRSIADDHAPLLRLRLKEDLPAIVLPHLGDDGVSRIHDAREADRHARESRRVVAAVLLQDHPPNRPAPRTNTPELLLKISSPLSSRVSVSTVARAPLPLS